MTWWRSKQNVASCDASIWKGKLEGQMERQRRLDYKWSGAFWILSTPTFKEASRNPFFIHWTCGRVEMSVSILGSFSWIIRNIEQNIFRYSMYQLYWRDWSEGVFQRILHEFLDTISSPTFKLKSLFIGR